MKSTIRFILSFVALAVFTCSIGCNQTDTGAPDNVPPSALKQLRADLESGTSQQKAEPFETRTFRPYLGNDWIGNAVAYGCYRKGQAPGQAGPSEGEILEDLQIISQHWNLIRVYGADDDTERILRVIKTHDLPIRVMLGVWLQNETDNPEKRADNIDQVMRGIELAGRFPEIVNTISVGNETQVFWSGHRMDTDNLIRYIRAVRNNVDVPVTTVDDYLYWNKAESKQVAEEIDFVVTHVHPQWNGQTLDHAIVWFDSIYHDIQEWHPEKAVVVGETGWATDYNPNLTGPGEQGTLIKGEVSVAAQGTYLIDLNQWIDSSQVPTFFFEAFDEPWKGGGDSSDPSHIEKHWGVYYEDRTPKESFLEYLDHVKAGQQ